MKIIRKGPWVYQSDKPQEETSINWENVSMALVTVLLFWALGWFLMDSALPSL